MRRSFTFPFRGPVPLAALTVLLAACGDHDPTAPGFAPDPTAAAALAGAADPRAEPLTVLARNIYLGADVATILVATSPLDVAIRAGQAWQQVVDNDAPLRAAGWAAEIALLRPHFVGLQEVATYWRQAPGDFLAGNPLPATDLEYDFLALLEAELAAAGASYRVAVVTENMHIELPMLRPTGLEDIRVLLRDVILVRSDVEVIGTEGGNFGAGLEVAVAGIPLVIPRGWASVVATSGGRPLRFVTTHLEAFHPLVQEAQAGELVSLLAARTGEIVLVGDLNSRPDGSRSRSYGIVRDAGFADVWPQANRDDPGYTCCQAADLSNATSILDERIDFVFVRDAFPQDRPPVVGGVRAWLVGADPADRVGGLWPSDHAGVAAALRLPSALATGH